MKTNIYWVTVLALIFLSGCAQMSPMANTQSKVHSAEVRSIDPNNHNAVAKYYEDAANEMKEKLQEQKKLLEEHEGHNAYGRRGQDRQSRITANIRQYENSIKENLKEAAIHRKMAQEEEKRELGFKK